MPTNMLLDNLQLPKTGADFIIRRLEERDLDDFYTLESDVNVKRFMGGAVSQPREQWIAGVKKSLCSSGYLAIEMRADGCFAGFASLGHFLKGSEQSSTLRELQILIGTHYQGRGIGTAVSNILISAAFFELGAERIYAVVAPGNRASIAMVGKLGFELAGEVDEIGSWQHGHKIFLRAK